jgi:hypothetical protein
MSAGELIASLAANFIVAGVVWYLRGPNAGLICLGIGMFLLIVAYFFRKKPSPQMPSQQNTQSVKVEASPQQHVHIDADILRQVKDLPKPEPLPPEPKPQPNIRFVESRHADIYHSDDTVFHETQDGLGDSKVTIACFRNESSFGFGGTLEQMNIEVNRSRVIRFECHDMFERGGRLLRPREW